MRFHPHRKPEKAVIQHKADLGIAYDGDADRCIVVDERGNEIDGDYIMLILPGYAAQRRTEPTNGCSYSHE